MRGSSFGWLRATYRRLDSARDKIAYVEAKSRDFLLELEEFEADRESYPNPH